MNLLKFKKSFLNSTKYLFSVAKNNQFEVNGNVKGVILTINFVEKNLQKYDSINLFISETGDWGYSTNEEEEEAIPSFRISYNPIYLYKSNYVIKPNICLKSLANQFINMLEAHCTTVNKIFVK